MINAITSITPIGTSHLGNPERLAAGVVSVIVVGFSKDKDSLVLMNRRRAPANLLFLQE
jgi:hypothetical protein